FLAPGANKSPLGACAQRIEIWNTYMVTIVQSLYPPSEVEEALTMILEYLWPEESLDYEKSSPEEKKRHIFNHVQLVQRWLTQLEKERFSAEVAIRTKD